MIVGPSLVPGPDTPSVLVIEADPVQRAMLLRSLSRIPDVVAVGAATLQEAFSLAAAAPPALVLLGSEVSHHTVHAMRVRFPNTRLVALTNDAPRMATIEGIECVPPPKTSEQLRELVIHRLGIETNDEQPFVVADYVQLAAMGHRTVALDVMGPYGYRGMLTVLNGELWSARDNQGEHGPQAFERLAFLPQATVRCRSPRSDELSQRNLTGNAESLLLDAARRHDELRNSGVFRALNEMDDLLTDLTDEAELVEQTREAQHQAAPDATPVSFDALYERGVEALLARDYRAAWDAFSAAASMRPRDSHVIANLQRLRELGHAR